MLARSTIRYLEEIAGFLGREKDYISLQDNKAIVSIALTVTDKQVMHIEYKIKPPDHDFVIAKQHKLVPSVISGIQVKAKAFPPDAVTYSGPIYIGIQSEKHLG